MYFGSISCPLSNLNNELCNEFSKEVDKCTKELLRYLGIKCSSNPNSVEILMIQDELKRNNAEISFNVISLKCRELLLTVGNTTKFKYRISYEIKKDEYVLTTRLLDLRR